MAQQVNDQDPTIGRLVHDATKDIIKWGRAAGTSTGPRPDATEIFGSLTFSDDVQRRRLPREVYKALRNDLPSFNGDPGWTLPMPGRFVIAADA